MRTLCALTGLYLLLQELLNAEVVMSECNASNQENVTHLTGRRGSLNASDPCCIWIITVTEENLVKLKTKHFSLNNSTLEIRDGQDSTSEVLETFTRNDTNKQQMVLSSGRHLWVRFQSFSEDDFMSVVAVFEAVKQGVASSCRKDKVVELNDTAGRIFSPLIPKRFSRVILCTWVIAAPEGLYVRLTIEKLKPEVDRQSSSLYIRDGRNSSSHLLNKLCDLKVKSTVFSSGRYLWVQFSSKKASYAASGFEAVFTAVKSRAPCTENSANVILRENSGTLSSYNYLSRYHKHPKRIWRFMMSKVKLRFYSFNLSDSKDCADEYLEIYRVRYCGSKRPASTVILNGSDMRIVYKSNGMQHTGFMARYTSARPKGDYMTTLMACLSGTIYFLVLSFVCYQCIRRDYYEDDEDTDVMNTLETECSQTSKEQETV